MPTTDYSYLGSGQVYMRDRSEGGGGLVPVGNISALGLAVNENVIELRDHTRPGGGTRNEVRRIESVELSATLHDLSPANFARGTYGLTEAVTAGSVSSEIVTAHKGALVRLAHANPTDVVVVDEDTGTTTYVAGTDYEVRPGGIFILKGGAITDGEELDVAYEHGAEDLVQALVRAGAEFEIHFEGLNEARSGKAVLVDIWRCRLGAAQNISLIGDEFAALELTGRLLADGSRGAGESAYFRTTIQR
ncbi:conserved hypothetical protein [Thioalkalivibrio sulfidiphilus HL-EbGr7]|uniref:Uncharacterized protein n=1 Tax=Thioalkalivibrio sulfidiphilus (strain HL-EbGR7) TaxID=396588 RepID=B8GUX6_THISH|nr:hypothetical protein [Thioalkalivibrio sulfidiphilus]ACL71487.1 conserved hypothetical protein [Thioalkalivibrio sulfidiphilus HL-EbGr7]